MRRFAAADAGHLYELDNDPEVMRYINGGTPTPFEAIQREVLPVFLKAEEPPFGFWALEERGSETFCGWVSLRPVDKTASGASLGYRLCRAVWGKGYATQAASALIDRAFAQTGVQRVVATTYEKNRASRRVMEKLGMRFVRGFRICAEDLHASDTHYATAEAEVWDGEDVEYAVEKAAWGGPPP